MNSLIKVSYCITLLAFLSGCGNSNNGFTAGNGSGAVGSGGGTLATTPTGVGSQKNLVMTIESISSLFDSTGLPGPQKTVTITGSVADRNGLPIPGGQTLYFDADWGTFPVGKTCVTDAEGICTVQWQSGNAGEVATDHLVYFVIYTLGEEEFFDNNGNTVFDDGDSFTPANDLPEPFIDCNHTGAYDAGLDIPIDINANGYTLNDSLWNGPDCQHSSLCSGTTQIYIWQGGYMDASAEDPNPTLTTNACQN
jgi:hypothetical protein